MEGEPKSMQEEPKSMQEEPKSMQEEPKSMQEERSKKPETRQPHNEDVEFLAKKEERIKQTIEEIQERFKKKLDDCDANIKHVRSKLAPEQDLSDEQKTIIKTIEKVKEEGTEILNQIQMLKMLRSKEEIALLGTKIKDWIKKKDPLCKKLQIDAKLVIKPPVQPEIPVQIPPVSLSDDDNIQNLSSSSILSGIELSSEQLAAKEQEEVEQEEVKQEEVQEERKKEAEVSGSEALSSSQSEEPELPKNAQNEKKKEGFFKYLAETGKYFINALRPKPPTTGVRESKLRKFLRYLCDTIQPPAVEEPKLSTVEKQEGVNEEEEEGVEEAAEVKKVEVKQVVGEEVSSSDSGSHLDISINQDSKRNKTPSFSSREKLPSLKSRTSITKERPKPPLERYYKMPKFMLGNIRNIKLPKLGNVGKNYPLYNLETKIYSNKPYNDIKESDRSFEKKENPIIDTIIAILKIILSPLIVLYYIFSPKSGSQSNNIKTYYLISKNHTRCITTGNSFEKGKHPLKRFNGLNGLNQVNNREGVAK